MYNFCCGCFSLAFLFNYIQVLIAYTQRAPPWASCAAPCRMCSVGWPTECLSVCPSVCLCLCLPVARLTHFGAWQLLPSFAALLWLWPTRILLVRIHVHVYWPAGCCNHDWLTTMMMYAANATCCKWKTFTYTCFMAIAPHTHTHSPVTVKALQLHPSDAAMRQVYQLYQHAAATPICKYSYLLPFLTDAAALATGPQCGSLIDPSLQLVVCIL